MAAEGLWKLLFRLALVPVVWVILQALAILLSGDASQFAGFVESVGSPTSEQAVNSLGDLGKIMSAVLAAMLTVTILVIQVAVMRFTPLVIKVFSSNRPLMAMGSFMAATELFALWLNASSSPVFLPRAAILFAMVVFTVALVMVYPYFSLLLSFLDPNKVILSMSDICVGVFARVSRLPGARVKHTMNSDAQPSAMMPSGGHDSTVAAGKRRNPVSPLAQGSRKPSVSFAPDARQQTPDEQRNVMFSYQNQLMDTVDRLADLGVKALETKQKTVATHVVQTLMDISLEYAQAKASFPADWFFISERTASSTDFIALPLTRVARIESERVWFEYKVLRKLQAIFGLALKEVPEMCYMIAMVLTKLGTLNMIRDDPYAVGIVLRVYNTLVRMALSVKDIRTTYNIAQHYRDLAEAMLGNTIVSTSNSAVVAAKDQLVVDIAKYFQYYAAEAYAGGLVFVSEILAFDLGMLCQRAFEIDHPLHMSILRQLLALNETVTHSKAVVVPGIRRAQIKLAVKYMAGDAVEFARMIFETVADDAPSILVGVWTQFKMCTKEEFWEINDRGANFDYLPPAEKRLLLDFFLWFEPCPVDEITKAGKSGRDLFPSTRTTPASQRLHNESLDGSASEADLADGLYDLPKSVSFGAAIAEEYEGPRRRLSEDRHHEKRHSRAVSRRGSLTGEEDVYDQALLTNERGTSLHALRSIRLHQANVAVLLLVPLIVVVFFAIVVVIEQIDASQTLFRTLVSPSVLQVYQSFGGVGHIMAMLIGLVLTVSTIVFQIAASRFTPMITAMFFDDPVLLFTGAFFVASNLVGVWISFSTDASFLSTSGAIASVVLFTLCVLYLPPYFSFLARFLEPSYVIRRIKHGGILAIARGQRISNSAELVTDEEGDGVDRPEPIAPRQAGSDASLARRLAAAEPLDHAQADVLLAVERLSDLGLAAIEGKDHGMSASVFASMSKLLMQYARVKPEMPDAWFMLLGEVRNNLDFISLTEAAKKKLAVKRVWVEWKVLRQFHVLFMAAYQGQRQSCHVITRLVRTVGEGAVNDFDFDLIDLVVKFFNTFLRFGINKSATAVLFNTYSEYRTLVQHMLNDDDPGVRCVGVECCGYLKYYAGVTAQRKMDFATTTACHDLSNICCSTAHRRSLDHVAVATIFVEMTNSILAGSPSVELRHAVRLAQVKLVAFYAFDAPSTGIGETHRPVYVRLVESLDQDSDADLIAVWHTVTSIGKQEFWEINDRGNNINYIPLAWRDAVNNFFGSFPGRNLVLSHLEMPDAEAGPVMLDGTTVDGEERPMPKLLGQSPSIRKAVSRSSSGLIANELGCDVMAPESVRSNTSSVLSSKPPEARRWSTRAYTVPSFWSYLGSAAVIGLTVILVLLIFSATVFVKSVGNYGLLSAIRGKQGFDNAAVVATSLLEVAGILLVTMATVTVVIVHVTSARFTPLVTALFYTDPVIFCILSTFTAENVIVCWLAVSVAPEDTIPVQIFLGVILVAASLLLVVPFCLYILNFFSPTVIVGKILRNIVTTAQPKLSDAPEALERRKTTVVAKCDDFLHLGLKAAQWDDKTLVSGVLDSLARFLSQYRQTKETFPPSSTWFRVPVDARSNMAFAFLSESECTALDASRLWLEWKVLHVLNILYVELSESLPSVVSLVSYHVSLIGIQGVVHGDLGLVEMCVKFLNTFMRLAINRSDTRTGFHIMLHYRTLIEACLDPTTTTASATETRPPTVNDGDGDGASATGSATTSRFDEELQNRFVVLAVQMCHYLRYYASDCYAEKLYFLTEVAAHDLVSVIVRAFAIRSRARSSIQNIFASLADESRVTASVSAVAPGYTGFAPAPGADDDDSFTLRGVRRAQIKLGVIYLSMGSKEHAQQVVKLMGKISPEMLESLAFELAFVDSKWFWEVNDRGTNHDYLTPAQKEELPNFLILFPGYAPGDLDLRSVGSKGPRAAPGLLFPNSVPQLNEDDRTSIVSGPTSVASDDRSRTLKSLKRQARISRSHRGSRSDLMELPTETVSQDANSNVGVGATMLNKAKDVIIKQAETEDDAQSLASRASDVTAEDRPRPRSVSSVDSSQKGGASVNENGQTANLLNNLDIVDATRLLGATLQRVREVSQGQSSIALFATLLARYAVYPLLAIGLVLVLVPLDANGRDATTWSDFANGIFAQDPVHSLESLGSVPEVMAIHLRILLLVSLASMQVAAMRFSPLVATMFLRDPVIFSVLCFFVWTTLFSLVTGFTVTLEYLPFGAMFIVLLASIAAFAMIMPFFAYVLEHLRPEVIIRRLSRKCASATVSSLSLSERVYVALAGTRFGASKTPVDGDAMASPAASLYTIPTDRYAPETGSTPYAEIEGATPRERALDTIWDGRANSFVRNVLRLSDLSIKSIAFRDRIIAARACHAMGALACHYMSVKSTLPETWFRVSNAKRQIGEMRTLSDEVVAHLDDAGLWVEWTVLRQLQAFFTTALASGPELCALVCTNTRRIAETAVTYRNAAALDICITFFNTYLRLAINAKAIRVAYNLLHEYTKMAQSILVFSQEDIREQRADAMNSGKPLSVAALAAMLDVHDRALRIGRFLTYYARICLDRGIPFVAMIIAFDLSSLCEMAFKRKDLVHRKLLTMLLGLDQGNKVKSNPFILGGIRRAQVKIATVYLAAKQRKFARSVYDHLSHLSLDECLVLYRALQACDKREFWEVNDRGSNFDYLPPAQKRELNAFFHLWYGFDEKLQQSKAEASRAPETNSNALVSSAVRVSASPSAEGERGDKSTRTHRVIRGSPGDDTRPGLLRWLGHVARRYLPHSGVFLLAIVILLLAFLIEAIVAGQSLVDFVEAFLLIGQSDASNVRDVSAARAMPLVAATLLSLIVSVSIVVVQLAASRFTPLITVIFLRDRAIFRTLGFFIFTQVLISLAAFEVSIVNYGPTLLTVSVLALSITLCMLFPYFATLIQYLRPATVVGKLYEGGMADLDVLSTRVEAAAAAVAAKGGLATVLAKSVADSGSRRSFLGKKGRQTETLTASRLRALSYASRVGTVADTGPAAANLSRLESVPGPRWESESLGDHVQRVKATVDDAIERLADICMKSAQWRDTTVAHQVLAMLGDLVAEYHEKKATLTNVPSWFEYQSAWSESPDFLCLSSDSVQDIVVRRSWLEWKTLRQFQMIYAEALTSSKEMCFLVAFQTRRLAENSAAALDFATVDLCIKFFNTYFRFSFNADDSGTAVRVMHQYRILGSDLINMASATSDAENRRQLVDKVAQVAKYLRFYGEQFMNKGAFVVVQTAATALDVLLRGAASRRSQSELAVVTEFHGYAMGILKRPGISDALATAFYTVLLQHYAFRIKTEGTAVCDRYLFLLEGIADVNETIANAIDGVLSLSAEPEFWEVSDVTSNPVYIAPAEQSVCRAVLMRMRNDVIKKDRRAAGPGENPMMMMIPESAAEKRDAEKQQAAGDDKGAEPSDGDKNGDSAAASGNKAMPAQAKRNTALAPLDQ